jgi:hypothetical protein
MAENELPVSISEHDLPMLNYDRPELPKGDKEPDLSGSIITKRASPIGQGGYVRIKIKPLDLSNEYERITEAREKLEEKENEIRVDISKKDLTDGLQSTVYEGIDRTSPIAAVQALFRRAYIIDQIGNRATEMGVLENELGDTVTKEYLCDAQIMANTISLYNKINFKDRFEKIDRKSDNVITWKEMIGRLNEIDGIIEELTDITDEEVETFGYKNKNELLAYLDQRKHVLLVGVFGKTYKKLKKAKYATIKPGVKPDKIIFNPQGVELPEEEDLEDEVEEF